MTALHGRASRREFIRAAAVAGGMVAAGCSPTAQPAPAAPGAAAPAKSAFQEDWDKLVAAAKSEGKVVVNTTAGVGYRRWLDAFERAFPGVPVDHQQVNAALDLIPRMDNERKAGLYSWDVLITAGPIAFGRLRPAGMLDPVGPLLIHPEATGDQGWRGGFDAGWLEKEKKWGYAFMEKVLLMAVNTDLVKDGEIKTVQDLLDPKWKGKMILDDVRGGFTFGFMNSVRLLRGDDTVKRIIVDQEPTFSKDYRQINEAMVRGRYAISNAVQKSVLQQFLEQGLGKNIKFLDVVDLSYITLFDALWVVNKAPHPNATKLFANWVLTKQGQEAYVKNIEQNSRRADVPVYDQLELPKPNQKYIRLGPEDSIPDVVKTQEYLVKLVGG